MQPTQPEFTIHAGEIYASGNPDYFDCFEAGMYQLPPPSLADIVYHFFTVWPKWVKVLFIIRNLVVLPFGLKGGKGKELLTMPKPEFIWQKNGRVAFFHIVYLTENEVVLEANDKHLDARFIIKRINTRESTVVSAKTEVYYHNTFGWCYFQLIKPFHKFIVKVQINQTIKSLQK